MTTQNENGSISEINGNNLTIAVIKKSSSSEYEKNQEESIIIDENEEKHISTHGTEEKNNINDDTEINSNSITKVNINEEQEQEQQKEETTPVNNHEDDNRPKRSFNSKYKYSSMPYHRAPCYMNGHPYGPAPYYYYQVAPITEKPPPLMIIPTQPPSTTTTAVSSTSPTMTTTTTTTATITTTDNQTSNSTTASSQNLRSRSRQTSANENDSNSQQSSSQISTTTGSQPTTNGRRHRSILPRGSCNYYSHHPPPPLMATPPGVLFPYPPTFHQPGHVAYNIRTPDEFELLAFQQQVMNLPPSLNWPLEAGYPPYLPYSIYDQSAYMYNNSLTMNSNSSLLNPEAAEWVPPITDNDVSSSDNNILIDDEINFPPLNNNRVEENNSEPHIQVDAVLERESTNNTEDKTTITSSKTDTTITNSSSSQDDTKSILSSSSKSTTISYSNVILQALDANKPNKTTNANTNNQNQNQNQRRQQQSTNQVHVQLPPRDRTNKQLKPQVPITKDIPSRRRPTTLNRNNFHGIRNPPSTEITKPQQHITDDWIEVKSKKTKKFDRSITDIQYENSTNISQKSLSDQHLTKTLSPPSSLSSISDNAMGTFTSEEDDDKDDLITVSDNKPIIVDENEIRTTTTKDCNQIIIDDIHRRLDNGEKLLILMRGCPGSGKSTLAKSLNNGYNGQIFSTDEYRLDLTKVDTVHLGTHELASDTLRKKISPIIIDNTNSTLLEMKPYAAMGREAGYGIILVEPQTPWRYKARELAKRNLHNIPLRRIKEMLNNFEQNVTVESLVGQTKPNLFVPSQAQNILEQNGIDHESIDPILTSKKSYNIIDDSNILNDVRLCINDMILFLTSTFYQTSQSSSSSLSLSFPDLSLIQTSSSSPTTPTTPYSLFHRSLSRFSSTTSSQDHSFTNEHLLRLPSTVFPRCIEKLTPPSSTNSSIIGKKRRKNKNKQQQHQRQQSNEILLNTNNNNNSYCNTMNEGDNYLQQSTYSVILPEDDAGFVIIDEQNDDDCCDNFIENFDQQRNFQRNHSSVNHNNKSSSNNKNDELSNIIHNELTQPSILTDQNPFRIMNHIALQCSSDDFNQEAALSDRILIGHLLTEQSTLSPPISPPAGYIECGTQVDLNENNIYSLSHMIELYSDRLSPPLVKQFYDLCNGDISSTRLQIEEYLKHNHEISTIPTLRQLSLNALNQWNEELRHSNPSFDTISIGDLLQDINDDDVYEELILDNETNDNSIQFTDTNQMKLPESIINFLQELYGELPIQSSDRANGLSLPLDDDLSMNLYQALQRFLGIPNKINKPVNYKKLIKENEKLNKQRWNFPTQQESNVSSNKKTSGPSLKEIMNEELNYINTKKAVQKPQLNFASQHKLKELKHNFPSLTDDFIYEMFCENESDYNLTLVCISSLLDENVSISMPKKSPSLSALSATTPTSNYRSTATTTETIHESYETLRRDARFHASKRKECFNKADQANRHGMIGVASYYINQAREQARLMKDANRTASEHLSRTRLVKFRQTHQLDLHELYPDEALHLFKLAEEELNGGNRRATPKSIEVITGYGKHSAYGGGCGKIRSTILAYLRQKKYK
ncbi:unnamed protein product [Rotaria socialis]|uniref:Smr domain-containing protein n=3 Tax=Rotaria socialis TaxID=392032 RepID=A0A820JBZ8_9BILA|nr:unnamed protein product [Rotaria socialis]